MEKMSTSVLAVPDDLVTPLLSWRLYVSQQRLVRARAKCAEVDKEASQLANKITEVEVENQEQQRLLEESLAAGAELKEKCMVEQQELSRLKQVWADTQPELPPGHPPNAFDSDVLRTTNTKSQLPAYGPAGC